MGTPDFAVPALDKLIAAGHEVVAVVTQPDRRQGRGKKIKPGPVKQTALAKGITVMQPEKLDNIFVKQLAELHLDVIAVVAYGKLLPEAVINLPRYGCINVHASLLPKYRGAAPIHRAIIDGERESGVTIMQMDRGMDTGPILAQKRVAIPGAMTAGELHDILAVEGADLLVKTLAELARGVTQKQQDNAIATYAPMLTGEDKRIDWREPAIEIINRVRGMNPRPGTYTIYQDKRLKIFKAELFPYRLVENRFEGNVKENVAPGTITELISQGFVVAAGDGNAVLVTEVQPPGKQKMQASDFLRGHAMTVGQRLGRGVDHA